MNSAPIISKIWSFCTTLRDDGVGYGDYLDIRHTAKIIISKANRSGRVMCVASRLKPRDLRAAKADSSAHLFW